MRIALLLLALLLAPHVLAIGISPARLTLDAGEEPVAFAFRPLVDGNASVRVEGPFAQHILLERHAVGPGDLIEGSLLPLPPTAPGEYEHLVIVSESADAQGTVSASSEAAAVLVVRIPRAGAFLRATWALEEQDLLAATVMLENLGLEAVTPASVTLEVGAARAAFVAPDVPPLGFAKTGATLQHPGRGIHEAVLRVRYNDIALEDRRAVRIGEPQLELSALSYPEERGPVRPLDVRGTVLWNRPLAVTLSVFIDNATEPVLVREDSLEGSFSRRLYLEQLPVERIRVTVTSADASAERVLTLGASTERLSLLAVLAIILVILVITFWLLVRLNGNIYK